MQESCPPPRTPPAREGREGLGVVYYRVDQAKGMSLRYILG